MGARVTHSHCVRRGGGDRHLTITAAYIRCTTTHPSLYEPFCILPSNRLPRTTHYGLLSFGLDTLLLLLCLCVCLLSVAYFLSSRPSLVSSQALIASHTSAIRRHRSHTCGYNTAAAKAGDLERIRSIYARQPSVLLATIEVRA